MNNDVEKEVVIKYEKSDNYFETYATAVYGGIGSHGELHMYFCEDIIPLPTKNTVVVDDNGKVLKKNYDLVYPERLVKCRVTMNPTDIPVIIEWLKDKYETSKKQREVAGQNNE